MSVLVHDCNASFVSRRQESIARRLAVRFATQCCKAPIERFFTCVSFYRPLLAENPHSIFWARHDSVVAASVHLKADRIIPNLLVHGALEPRTGAIVPAASLGRCDNGDIRGGRGTPSVPQNARLLGSLQKGGMSCCATGFTSDSLEADPPSLCVGRIVLARPARAEAGNSLAGIANAVEVVGSADHKLHRLVPKVLSHVFSCCTFSYGRMPRKRDGSSDFVPPTVRPTSLRYASTRGVAA